MSHHPSQALQFDGCPVAMTPIYATQEPNESFNLYSGPLEVIQQGKSTNGDGSIWFALLPSPRVTFELCSDDPIPKFHPGPVSLKVPPRFANLEACATHIRSASQEGVCSLSASGRVTGPANVGTGQNLAHVLFHVLNYHDQCGDCICSPGSNVQRSGRITLEGGGWRITLDAVENLGELWKALDERGGYAVTHVGKMERADGRTFTQSEADEILGALYYFFSFTRGLWSAPNLPVGFDPQGNRVWEQWGARSSTSWKVVNHWFDRSHSGSLGELFPGFLDRYSNPDWSDAVKLAIHWYVESNTNAGGTEGAIVLTQAALELMSWAVLVEELGTYSEATMPKQAQEKLRFLLNQLSIPLSIPNGLRELTACAAGKQLPDGPAAFTWLRNGIVHFTRRNRGRVVGAPTTARNEAWQLGLWYLELILLHWFGFRGEYSNRTIPGRYAGQVEPVPWR